MLCFPQPRLALPQERMLFYIHSMGDDEVAKLEFMKRMLQSEPGRERLRLISLTQRYSLVELYGDDSLVLPRLTPTGLAWVQAQVACQKARGTKKCGVGPGGKKLESMGSPHVP